MIKGNWILGNEDASLPIAVREEVFSGELGLAGFCAGDEDDYAVHCILYDDGVPAASSRIYFDGEKFLLDSICVKKEHRGRQIGDLLARLTIMRASEYAERMFIHCFADTAGFFTRYGFKPTGEKDNIGKYPALWLCGSRGELRLSGKCGDCRDCRGCEYGEVK